MFGDELREPLAFTPSTGVASSELAISKEFECLFDEDVRRGRLVVAGALAVERPVEVTLDTDVILFRQRVGRPARDERRLSGAAPRDDRDDVLLRCTVPGGIECRALVVAAHENVGRAGEAGGCKLRRDSRSAHRRCAGWLR